MEELSRYPAGGATISGHPEPRDTLIFDGVAVPADAVAPVSDDVIAELELRGALSRTLLMAGAAQAVADLTIDYANERKAFGREIVRFQAVSQRLVQLVSEAELAGMSAIAAMRCLDRAGSAAAFEVAAAKATTATSSPPPSATRSSPST